MEESKDGVSVTESVEKQGNGQSSNGNCIVDEEQLHTPESKPDSHMDIPQREDFDIQKKHELRSEQTEETEHSGHQDGITSNSKDAVDIVDTEAVSSTDLKTSNGEQTGESKDLQAKDKCDEAKEPRNTSDTETIGNATQPTKTDKGMGDNESEKEKVIGDMEKEDREKDREDINTDVIKKEKKLKKKIKSTKPTIEVTGSSNNVDGVSGGRDAAVDTEAGGKTEIAMDMSQDETHTGISPEILKVLTGLCPFDELPPLPKKVVRIFVSSTFTDTKEERNALMQQVYPKLADYCREKHGLEFQIVDMRWGVPEQASDNHTTSELCIQEIKKCQEVSVGPNFVAIVGDKYGYRPIPRSVEEGLFQSLAAAQVEGWDVVEDWYKRDDNAVPAVFILQPISSKIQNFNNVENAELRQAAWEKWSSTSQQLSVTLRDAAEKACADQCISLLQKQLFYMSVTENEITAGIIEGRTDPSESCYCVIRKINDIDNYLNEVKAPRFIDVKEGRTKDVEAVTLLDNLRDQKLKHHIPESNVTMLDIEWAASGACMSLENYKDVNVLKYAQKFYKDKTIGLYRHKEYIDSFCDDFFAKIRRLIRDGSIKQMKMYDDLTTEILQHFHLAKMRCDVFEGRENLLSETKRYLAEKDTSFPLIIYGNSGCGKTSVMAKVFENVSNRKDTNHRRSNFTVVARFLGTSTKTSNVHQLLVSMCMQLSIVFQTPWKEPQQFSELVKSFYRLLENATPLQPILLLLDSIDQLMPIYNAYKLHWLPDEFPPNVKLIASTIDEGYTILKAFEEKYTSGGLKTVEVHPLGEQLGLEVILKWLKKDKRQVTEEQIVIVQHVLSKCSLPLYARIVYDHVRLWRSYDTPTVEQLDTTVKGAINKLFQQMEEKFGKHPVQHSLCYLTASRYGLSEAELEHILSLDDMLLNKIFRLWNPPVRRIPPLIWTRIRSEVQSYIVERSADDQVVLYWYHRQFILTTKSRYLVDEKFSKHISTTLIEYFSGKWGSGKEKPFRFTNSQMKRFGLDQPESKADRKVPGQPYWTEQRYAGKMDTRYNKRKLSELPYHLLKNKDYDQLKEQVFFSYEWLFAKMKSASVQQMIEEADIFMRADKVLKKDAEMKILYANLQLIRPYVITYPDSLSYELSGRLAMYVGKYQNITVLLKQCDRLGVKYCPLIPLTTCFETASLGFQQNLNFRSKEPWHEGGTLTCSHDFKVLYVVDYNGDGLPIVSSWDAESGQKINETLIKKKKSEETRFTTDLYLRAECTKDGKELLCFYKQRMDATYMKKMKSRSQLIDVVNLETGEVQKTYETTSFEEVYFGQLFYLTENYMCVTHSWKMPLINFKENIFNSFNRPTLLSPDEKLFIMCGKDKTVLRTFDTKEFILEFDVPEHQMAVTSSDDFSIVAMMGAETKDIYIFDLTNKLGRATKDTYQLLKSRHVFKLDEKTTESIAILFKPTLETLEDGRIVEKRYTRVTMTISPDKRHLMVLFLGSKWMAFLWNINFDKYSTKFVGKYSAKFIGAITPFRMQYTSRYPVFNHESSALVYSTKNRRVLIVSTENVEIINEYEMKQDIKAICISKVSNKVAVMLQKSILLLNVMQDADNAVKGKSKPTTSQLTQVLLPRETIKGVVQSEIVQKTSDVRVELEEVEDLSVTADTDRVASATSRSRQAVEKYYTPNGFRVLHLHKKVQVIDTVNQDVKYSPKSGEMITRSITNKDGTTVNEILPLPDISTRISSDQMGPGLDSFDKAMMYGRKHVPNQGSHKDTLKDGLLKPIISRRLSENVIMLRQGDRIVNENSKIKFRVTSESEGQLQVMVVPSVLTIYTVEEMNLKKLQRVTMYQETVIHTSNAYFVTSKTNPLGNFIKVYDQVKGKALAVHGMPFACECATFSEDEECLFVVDRSLTVKILQGPHFMGVLRTFSILGSELSSAFIVKEIKLFESNQEAILVRYGPEGPDIFVRSRYIFYDFVSNSKSEEINVSRRLEDISSDGRFGVDTELNLYDLKSGRLFAELSRQNEEIDYEGIVERRIRYTEVAVANEMIARISADNKYLVYLNKSEDTLHLISITGDQLKVISSCFAHMPDILPDTGVSLRCNSSVVLLKAKQRLVPIALHKEGMAGFSYDSEYGRSKSIMNGMSKKSKTSTEKIKVHSVFHQRKLFLQQEEMVMQKLRETGKKSNKPSVLIVGEPILCSSSFKSDQFSPNLVTNKMSVQNVDDAFLKMRGDAGLYDAIILQLITEDVTMYDTAVCVKKTSVLVEMARQRAKLVVISYAPPRGDSKELSDKIREVNDKLGQIYASSCGGGKHLHFCRNTNLSDNGKPIVRFFKEGVQLSTSGIKKICGNFRQVLAPMLGMHHI